MVLAFLIQAGLLIVNIKVKSVVLSVTLVTMAMQLLVFHSFSFFCETALLRVLSKPETYQIIFNILQLFCYIKKKVGAICLLFNAFSSYVSRYLRSNVKHDTQSSGNCQ